MLLREYQAADAEALSTVYRDAVIGTGSSAYDPTQIKVWSAYPDDMKEFRKLLSLGLTLVAMEESRCVAFGQLNLDRIAFLYTATDRARCGYATAIYRRLQAHAMEQGVRRLRTEASRISKHFFLKMGFQLVETEIVDRKDVPFERFRMEKALG